MASRSRSRVGNPGNGGMDMADASDSVRALIDRRLQELKLDMATVSEARLGKNRAYLQQYLKRGVPRELPEKVRGQLAGILGVPENDLRPSAASTPPTSVRPAPAAPRAPSLNADNKDVPVLGTAEGGPNGAFEVYYGGDPVDWVRRFPGIEKTREVYALYVVGNSMSPRHEPGDLIYVHPSKAPAIGCDVIIQIRPKHEGDSPRCYLKRLARRTADKVICEQFCPAEQVTYAKADIIAMHRVLTLAELAGA